MAKKIKYDGQDVVATYAEKDKKGVDLTDRVTTTTNQTISGVKTFTVSPQIKDTNNGDAYINFNTDTYAGLVFRYGNGGTSGQPSAEIIYYDDTSELNLYASGGVTANEIYETNSFVPYKIGYKYSGYISSTSSASNKYYVCFQFFDDARYQGYISGRGSNITTMANLIAALKRAGHISANSACPASGKYGTNNVIGVYSNGTNLTFEYLGYSSNTNAVSTANLSASNTTVGTVNFTAINS